MRSFIRGLKTPRGPVDTGGMDRKAEAMTKQPDRRHTVRRFCVASAIGVVALGIAGMPQMANAASARPPVSRVIPSPTVGLSVWTVSPLSGFPITFSVQTTRVGVPARTVQLQMRQGLRPWQVIGSQVRRDSRSFLMTWTPLQAGTYSFRAVLAPSRRVSAVVSSVRTLTVAATSNTLAITTAAVGPWDTPHGFGAVIAATPFRAARGRTLSLQVRKIGGTWTTVDTKVTPTGWTTLFNTFAQTGEFEGRALLAAAPGFPAATSNVVQLAIRPTLATPTFRAAAVTPQALGGVANPGFLAPAAASSIRLWGSGVSWRDIETSPGVYNWTLMDQLVADAQLKGQSILYTFGSTPTFYAANQPVVSTEYYGVGAARPPADMNNFRAFVTALATRYAGKIEAYQSWNELNVSGFWQGTPAQAAQMTNIIHQVVANVAGTSTTHPLVVSASVGTRLVNNYYDTYRPYLQALAALNWPVDAFSGHFYPLYSGTVTDALSQMTMFRRVLSDNGAPALPIWNTEMSYRADFSGNNVVPEYSASETRALIAKTTLMSLTVGISRTYWYAWTSHSGLTGITFDTGTTGEKTVVQLHNWLAGVASVSPCLTSPNGLVTCTLTMANATTRVVAWSNSGPRPLAVPFAIGSVRTLTGTTTAPTNSPYMVDAEPVLVSP